VGRGSRARGGGGAGGDGEIHATRRGRERLAQRDADALVAREAAQLAADQVGVGEIVHVGAQARQVGVAVARCLVATTGSRGHPDAG